MNINPKKSSQHVYDYVVVGSGLSGLLVTAALSRVAGASVLLLEASDTYGGVNHRQNSVVGPVNNGLRFFPDSDLSRKSLNFLSELLGHELGFQSVENAPLTFESAHLRPFVGFGDKPPAFYDQLSYFLSKHRLLLENQVYDWSQELFESSSADFMPRSIVTKFVEENGQVHHVIVNGQKNILGHNFIHCGPLQSLAVMLPESALSPKSRQKLAKTKSWNALCLDLVHSQVLAEPEKLHVLDGASQDEVGPCVGQFFAPLTTETETLQLSQWVSFIDAEDAEDAEQIGLALKKIKRQIKRAYPTAFDAIKSERIFVAPAMGSESELKLSANQSLPNLPNLWIASGALSSQKNLLGCLQQAELVCSALGFHPAVIEVAGSPPSIHP